MGKSDNVAVLVNQRSAEGNGLNKCIGNDFGAAFFRPAITGDTSFIVDIAFAFGVKIQQTQGQQNVFVDFRQGQ